MASLKAASSRGSTMRAPPPAAISRMLPKSEVMTGVPAASDSATGRPKPSWVDARTVKRAEP